MRLIDADAFKEYIQGACEEMSHVYKDGGKWAKQITEDFCMDIDEQPTIEPEPQWIPVDLQNNSPEENKVVLLGVRFRDDFKYFATSRQDYNYWIGLGRAIKGELKWQPLPEPFREEGEQS